jgi:hypothetical protein
MQIPSDPGQKDLTIFTDEVLIQQDGMASSECVRDLVAIHEFA